MLYSVYTLVDPRSNEVRYVGITSCPEVRLAQHIRGIDDMNEYKVAWIEELKEQKLRPQMRIIETVESRETAMEREQYWVKYYLNQNIPLVNITLVPTDKRRSSRLNSRKRIFFFNQLNREWRYLCKVNKPLTTNQLESLFDSYIDKLADRFPSKRDLVPLWKEKKREEIEMMLADPNKYGLLPTFPGDVGPGGTGMYFCF